MFLHLGGDVMVRNKDIIMILDEEIETSILTREFFKNMQGEGVVQVINSKNKRKSFIVAEREVFVSPISCQTLRKRIYRVHK
ncbi:MAG TPA: DUF370 domain-containing protein [Desulfotomaculum sp.]|jgi:hypothetical protein|nr:DUF370 domain-containing protein [Desulfotomaculum sp.]HCJ79830.1 DUF370 domain-containing protein [Desulfotomaculum sp.]